LSKLIGVSSRACHHACNTTHTLAKKSAGDAHVTIQSIDAEHEQVVDSPREIRHPSLNE
jgi:hypothetical protein